MARALRAAGAAATLVLALLAAAQGARADA